MIKVLGQGGMGSVMLARAVSDGGLVAIKTFCPNLRYPVSEKISRGSKFPSSPAAPNIVCTRARYYKRIVYLVTDYVREWMRSARETARLQVPYPQW